MAVAIERPLQGRGHLSRPSSFIIVGDVQHMSTRLAVDGVWFVALQPALGTRVEHLAAWAEYSLR